MDTTFIQPHLTYITDTKTTFTINSESTYDWNANEWTVPFNFIVSQLVQIGQQPVQFFGGVRWHADKPDGGPDWGLRFGT